MNVENFFERKKFIVKDFVLTNFQYTNTVLKGGIGDLGGNVFSVTMINLAVRKTPEPCKTFVKPDKTKSGVKPR